MRSPSRSFWRDATVPADYAITTTTTKTRLLPFVTLSQTLNLADFSAFSLRHVRCRKRLSWRLCSIDASLSHWASTFVYNTMVMTQSVARYLCGSWDLFRVAAVIMVEPVMRYCLLWFSTELSYRVFRFLLIRRWCSRSCFLSSILLIVDFVNNFNRVRPTLPDRNM